MSIWLIILMIVVVVVVFGDGWGYRRRTLLSSPGHRWLGDALT
jgi:hypothetical protein